MPSQRHICVSSIVPVTIGIRAQTDLGETTMNELRERIARLEQRVGTEQPEDGESLAERVTLQGEQINHLHNAHMDWVKDVETQILSLVEKANSSIGDLKKMESKIALLKGSNVYLLDRR